MNISPLYYELDMSTLCSINISAEKNFKVINPIVNKSVLRERGRLFLLLISNLLKSINSLYKIMLQLNVKFGGNVCTLTS